MDGEVVHPLFRLLEQRIAEGFPGEIFGDPVDLLQSLVDRHRTDRYRTIAQDPLAGLVNIAAGGEVHDRIRSPARRPHQLLDLFFNRRSDRRVADIGVNLHEEVAANNHRFGFRMINIGRDNRAPGGDFSPHKLRGDILRQPRAKPNARMLLAQHFATNTLAAHILTNGDELHFRGDNPLTGVVQLRHAFPDDGAPGREQAGKAQFVEAIIRQPLSGIGRAAIAECFAVAARINPRLTQFCQTLLNVNRDVRIAIGTGGVIDRNSFVRFVLRIIFAAADKRRA